MAQDFAWFNFDLSGVRDSQNFVYTIPNLPSNATVWIFHQGIELREVPISPEGTQCIRVGTLVTLGIAPNPDDDLWVKIAAEIEVAFADMDTMVAASGPTAARVYLQEIRDTFYFNVHRRDVLGNLQEIILNDVADISWSYGTVGGCLEANIVLRRPFDTDDPERTPREDDEIEIWREVDQLGEGGARLPAQFLGAGIQLGTSHIGARQLRWSGHVYQIDTILKPDADGDIGENIALHCVGHGSRLGRTFIPGYQPNEGQDVGAVVRHIVDTYVLPATKIKRTAALGLCHDTGIEIGQVKPFFMYASQALEMLAVMAGNAEWGVDARREFFFCIRQNVLKQSYPIGGRINLYLSRRSSDDEVHRLYIQGGNGHIYIRDLAPFQPGNQKDLHVTVGAVTSEEAATQWAVGFAATRAPANVTPSGQLKLVGGADWIEGGSHPIGLLRVFGGPVFVAPGTRLPAQLPFELAHVYGAYTDTRFRVAKTTYKPDGDVLNADVELGPKTNEFADLFMAVESKMSQFAEVQAQTI